MSYIFFPQQILIVEMESRRYNIYHASLSKWIRILRLTSLWECPEICEVAVSYINRINMETIHRIDLYQEYRVERRHILPFYLELARREEMLGREEFRVLDVDTLFSIVRAREMLRAPYSADGDGRDTLSSPLQEHSEDEMLGVLAIAFGIPVEAIREFDNTGWNLQPFRNFNLIV